MKTFLNELWVERGGKLVLSNVSRCDHDSIADLRQQAVAAQRELPEKFQGLDLAIAKATAILIISREVPDGKLVAISADVLKHVDITKQSQLPLN